MEWYNHLQSYILENPKNEFAKHILSAILKRKSDGEAVESGES